MIKVDQQNFYEDKTFLLVGKKTANEHFVNLFDSEGTNYF